MLGVYENLPMASDLTYQENIKCNFIKEEIKNHFNEICRLAKSADKCCNCKCEMLKQQWSS